MQRASAEAFVLDLYNEFLSRAPSELEREGWIGRLLKGAPPAAVREAIGQLRETADQPRIVADVQAPEAADQRRISAERDAIARSGLFDASWYLLTNQDVADAGADPLDHYIAFGRKEGRAANAYLMDHWYRKRTRIRRGTDALLHYLHKGEPAGQRPGPSFDPKWYRDIHQLPDGVSPLAHFLARRMTEDVAPCPALWSVANMPADPAAPGGSDPFLSHLAQDDDVAATAAADIAVLARSGLIDPNYYLVAHSDVTDAETDPALHFCAYGWKEGRNPNAYFDTKWYVTTNPEVTRLGINPLVHYLLVGEKRDRRPVVYFEPGWYRAKYGLADEVSPLAHFLANRHNQCVSPNSLFDPPWFIAQPGRKVPRRQDPFAFYLFAATSDDMQPSAAFDAIAWRKRSRGRRSRHFTELLYPDKDNPLVNYMLTTYR